ncbi:MAG: glycosyltransferase family 4 protein [Candidatus Azobacteroides sp.]|nr:glycosyltransferase family 4 protein [Candidatus Azobacteroides sp.]
MKICFFNTSTTWGGGETWHFDVARCCARKGHQVVVVSSEKSELLNRASAAGLKTKAFAISNLSFLNPYKVATIRKFFNKERFDIVIFNFSKDLKNAAWAAKKAGIKKIIFRRGSAVPIKNTFLNRFIYGKCLTDIIANSEATKKTILQNNPELFPRDKIKVIYNGLNPKAFQQGTWTENPIPIIGNLGRCVYQKRQDLLLEVAAILKQRNIDCLFRIGGDGPMLEELKRKAAELNVSDRVEFAGLVHSPAEFMKTIDIFALPSEWEGFGYVITEAMASGKPVVAFDISSNPELIVNNETGYLLPYPDKKAFAKAIEELLLSPEKRKVYGENGKKRVAEKFDFDKNMKEVERFLDI